MAALLPPRMVVFGLVLAIASPAHSRLAPPISIAGPARVIDGDTLDVAGTRIPALLE
jgi:endonuclease YncB( thermonuclease family)